MNLEQIMEIIKLNEADCEIGVLALIDNPSAVRVAAAFSLMEPPEFRIVPGSRLAQIIEKNLTVSLDDATLLEAMWESTVINMRDLAARAGIRSVEVCRAAMYVLQSNRIIYPDGTLNAFAETALNRIARGEDDD